MKLTRFLVPFVLLWAATSARAIVLHGMVSDVRDGKSIVVVNSNRTLTVILQGVDAPELLQEFGDVARQHLSSLILGKQVRVEFTQLQLTNVVGRVVLNNTDIGLQVIRDGVAWYDKSNNQDLSEDERRIYGEAEQLARDERRGMWHDGSPMPPWEWRRAQIYQAVTRTTHPPKRPGGGSLTNEDLAFARKAVVASSPPSSKSAGSLPKPTAHPMNRIGEDYDYRSYLTLGRVSIVYFYADWCPACRQTTPLMDAINAKVPDMQVLFLNIGAWDTPITRTHGITFVPYLKIYDKSGDLVAEGHGARDWLAQTLR